MPGGTCGVEIDLASLAPGLDFGCVSTASLPDGGPGAACGQDAGPTPDASTGGLPPGCPGTLGDYVGGTVTGTAGDDTFGDQSARVVILGLGGDDTYGTEILESNCLVGGPGNDRFLYGHEGSQQTCIGGPGNDVFVIDTGPFGGEGAVFYDLNVEGDDEIHLPASLFGLTGAPGSTASATEVVSIPDHSGGGFPSGAGAAARVAYDPTDGELYADTDGSGPAISRPIGRILNVPAFDVNDYKLE
jgi:hypothetical protein